MALGTRGTLVVAAAVALVVTAVPATGAFAGQSDRPEADNTVTRIEVGPDGTATWTVQIRTRIETDEERQAFDAFRERFRENRSRYVAEFGDGVESAVANAEAATGRNMSAENVTARTDVQVVPRRWGIVTYEFRWTNFARAEGDRLVVGDVFDSGFFIGGNDSLQIVAPEGYEVAQTDPQADGVQDRVATWTGRTDFADGRPVVVLEPAPTESSHTPSDPAVETDDGAAAGGPPLWPLLLAAFGVLATGIVATRRDRFADAVAARLPGSTADSETGGEPEAGHAGGAGDGGGETVTEPTDPVTDEERLVGLVEDEDGEIKQADLVDRVDWSKSKVSRLLSDLEDDGRVERVRIGREKLVRLTDDE